jgi:hypothetical protein
MAARLRARREEIAQGIYEHIQACVPHPVSDANPVYQEALRATIAAIVDYIIDGLVAGRWTRPMPDVAAAQARRAAYSGVSLGMVLRRYVAAHSRFGEYVREEAARQGLSRDELHYLRRRQEALLERLTAAIEHEYNKDHESPAVRRAGIVRRTLRSQEVSSAELAELEYEIVAAWHIGMIAVGSQASQAVETIRRGLRCELLAVPSGDEALWAWFGTRGRVPAKALSAHLPGHFRVRSAIGEPRHGRDGLLRTHAEALAAWPVAMKRGEPAVYAADVTLDAALLANDVLAKLHHETFLAPLESLRVGGHTARETLRAYFSCAGSIASAGAKLEVTPRTVENRLQAIARTLDRPLYTCLAELEVALQLEELAATRRSERASPSRIQ